VSRRTQTLDPVTLVASRGPGHPGGVSSTVERVQEMLKNMLGVRPDYAYFEADGLRINSIASTKSIPWIGQDLAKRSRSYAAEYLWPCLHNLAVRSTYRESDLESYENLSRQMANALCTHVQEQENPCIMFQDYECAMMPGIVRKHFPEARLSLFWHLAFPSIVKEHDIKQMTRLAQGMLGADTIGFHTRTFAQNFLDLVSRHMSDRYKVDNEQLRIYTTGGRFHTQIVIAPLGLDVNYWQRMTDQASKLVLAPKLSRLKGTRYALNADRLDFTKAHPARLEALRLLFITRPEYVGNLSLVHAGTNSRAGMKAYDEEAAQITQMWDAIKSEFHTTRQPPLTYLGQLDQAELAWLYQNAAVLVENPVLDGLNLVVKEFIACQRDEDPGVVLLSSEAGAFIELQEGVVQVDPTDPVQIASAIVQACEMPLAQRRTRMQKLKQAIMHNTLEHWLKTFCPAAGII
jgi:trehalose 6-phosphate synthase/phosphatase